MPCPYEKGKTMVEINMTYEGDLRVRVIHGPSGTELTTDAPKDNFGKGESFSPTDLAATALGSCIATVMGITAKRKDIDLIGMTIKVEKEMVNKPARRVGSLTIDVNIPKPVDLKDRKLLENVAATCPVHKSLHPDVKVTTRFSWV